MPINREFGLKGILLGGLVLIGSVTAGTVWAAGKPQDEVKHPPGETFERGYYELEYYEKMNR